MNDHEPSSGSAPSPVGHLSHQAGVELAQELVLVSSTLFTQLLPGSADHALSGVPGMQRRATSPGTPAAAPAPMAAPRGVEPARAVQATVAPALSVPLPPPPSQVQTELDAAPLVAPPLSAGPSLPLIEAIEAIEVIEVLEVLEAPEDVPMVAPTSMVPRPPQNDRRSQAMLAEIGFLDEGDAGTESSESTD